MRRYVLPTLSQQSANFLLAKQNLVDAEIGREAQYRKATDLFGLKSNAAFNEVRQKLASAGSSDEACYYCERDRYRDIDHVRPKRHYPELAFEWSNYVYACVICNQDQKRDTFGVISGVNLKRFDRSLSFSDPVPTGIAALIDVRTENPFDFLKLDLVTGNFVPIGDDTSKLRGTFTVDLFGLNDAPLSRVRRHHVAAYTDYLQRYLLAKDAQDASAMTSILNEIKELSHRTVFLEMVRQHDQHLWLKPLIEALPVSATIS